MGSIGLFGFIGSIVLIEPHLDVLTLLTLLAVLSTMTVLAVLAVLALLTLMLSSIILHQSFDYFPIPRARQDQPDIPNLKLGLETATTTTLVLFCPALI